MGHLALDLSKSSTGWALWQPSWDVPRYGHWALGSEFSTDGQVYMKLHRCMGDLYKVSPFERLYYEDPIDPVQLKGKTNIKTLKLLWKLAGHAESFGAAKRCRLVKEVNISSWRIDFIGRDVHRSIRDATKAAQKSARDPLKAATMERCRQLGFTPRKNDEADAIGILTYSLLLGGITPPWLAAETLRPALQGAAA